LSNPSVLTYYPIDQICFLLYLSRKNLIFSYNPLLVFVLILSNSFGYTILQRKTYYLCTRAHVQHLPQFTLFLDTISLSLLFSLIFFDSFYQNFIPIFTYPHLCYGICTPHSGLVFLFASFYFAILTSK
jgi:hypothetical protein